jgi:saccharopine dehydrogenase-like NADP-dependent oxidoreductase
MNPEIIVLGAGLVGNAMAIDLKQSGYNVTSADINKTALKKLAEQNEIDTVLCDLNNPAALTHLIKNAQLVVGAVPGAIGFNVLKTVIEVGKNIVDISFCPEDYFELDTLAKEKGVTAIVDMGVAPGMCNAILGYHDTQMQVESYKCIVGGLPLKREWPFEYKASWSPRDVIEEYTRPARLKENGNIITKPALSDMELVNVNPVGTLEEWNSDGLRSLLSTMPHIPDMVEKTLRYPGTMQYMKILKHAGFFSEKEIEVGNSLLKPVDVSAALLLPAWKLEEGEAEFTAMQVVIKGKKNGKSVSVKYNLYDVYNAESNTLSMARTTGYTCTGAAKLILEGTFTKKGIIAPEVLGADEASFKALIDHLADRNVVYTITKE